MSWANTPLALPRLLVSAAHKSSGKTTVTLGLAAAFSGASAAQGRAVQCFKKGPDYIDPMWLALASGRPCYNLDPHLSDVATIMQRAAQAAADADLALIEGNKGLYDGLSLDGSNSNAALAKLLAAPVLLVLDARGMTRGVAPLILGYQAFDREIRIAGVVLNRVGGSRHEAKLRAVIEHYTDVPVLGAVAEDTRLSMAERHLGLPTCTERDDARAWVQEVGRIIAAQVDLPRLRDLAAMAPALAAAAASDAGAPERVAGGVAAEMAPEVATEMAAEVAADVSETSEVRKVPRLSKAAPAAPPAPAAPEAPLRLGIARDRAFGFYYPDDLQALRTAGAQLVFIDALHDAALPALDGLFIGGGFPETSLEALQANVPLRQALRQAIEAGLPTYAECGGLMYLARSIMWRDRRAEMVGVIPGDAVMHERPVGRGYVELEETVQMPWPDAGGRVRGHEFHHSSLVNLDPGVGFAYRVARGHGIDGRHDGVCLHNLLASYSHLRGGAGSSWPQRFVTFARQWRSRVQGQGLQCRLTRDPHEAGKPRDVPIEPACAAPLAAPLAPPGVALRAA